ncbi:hypothetical protein ACMD2_13225 [Ananas comosus]|uniref:Uncharacterized protein n=1 Tax=Ananas comosus TaxID=4615 RepID=A0A199UNC4_ANACO|nr:hypothetical protein ACMD2_13225 [Ananas comosus]
MAIPRMKKRPRPLLLLALSLALATVTLVLFGILFFSAASSLPTLGSLLLSAPAHWSASGGGGGGGGGLYGLERRYLYWGRRIDCPGKHCESCAGLGHQESSLRCALEEALFLQRVFVMPSRMCISSIHNKKGILHSPSDASSEERFMECKDRTNHSSILLSHSLLPTMAAKRLQNVADKIKKSLGDYDAIHVRRGDRLKTRKDRFGVDRSRHPHLDRDTRPEFIHRRIAKWIPPGRTLFIASDERTPGFFSPLSAWYKLAYSSNFSSILDPVIENNYQLFMVERLIMGGAKTFVKTFKEDENDLFLTDDPKKNPKNWQMPVYTDEEDGS